MSQESLMVNEKVMMSAIRARRRFKAIVRLVIQNLVWLEEIEPLGDNIRKNVKLMMRKHKGTKSLLTLKEKALLNKPAEDRTDEEKLLLYRRIGGLKCFRKYPENVKMELAGVTYFAYYGSNRVIVREHHYAHALYFIISGEVIATTEIIDPVTYDKVINNMGTMITGQTFGEVSLLHNLPRNATITTMTPTEFLVLKRGDFDRVLKSTIQNMWDHIESIMDSFTYFNDWDDLTKKECCVIAKIKYYKKDDIIFGDGFGLKQWVYFIVTGKCQMIESLQVEVSYVDGKKKYRQYEAVETVSIKVDNVDKQRHSVDKAVSVHSATKKSPQSSSTNTPIAGGKRESMESLESLKADSELSSSQNYVYLPNNVEEHFMQVCLFLEKACFFGETMVRRRIVAMTNVECMIIPKYWFQLRSRAHIWVQIAHYLHTHIPTTRDVYLAFLRQRKWRAYKKDLITSLSPELPCNNIHNVPYSVRIIEDYDYERK